MTRSKNKKIKGGVWYNPSTWGPTNKLEEVKKEEEPIEENISSTLESDIKKEELDQQTPSPAPAEKSFKNLWGLIGGKSRKAKKRKSNKTKKSKK